MTTRRARAFSSVDVLGLGLVAWSVVSCGQQPVVVPSRTLDRPTDMAFVCLQATPAGAASLVTARPANACPTAPQQGDARSQFFAPRTTAAVGLITNSARGELGAVDFDRKRVVDLDEAVPGFTMLPVGQLPESVAVSSDGCKALTANRGSCDLSVVDNTRLLANLFDEGEPSTGRGPVVNDVSVITDSGPLRARPGTVAFVPEPTAALSGAVNACQIAGSLALGQDDVRPWQAVVTFPTCGLVALVDVPTGRLVDSVYVRPDGVVPAGTNPECPAECGGPVASGPDASPGTDAALDGDAAFGGEATPGRVRVEALSFLPYLAPTDGRAAQRLYVGGRNADLLVPLEVEDGRRLVAPRPPLLLAEGAGGVLRVRPSVDPFQPPETPWVGDLGRFVYVVTGDGTVRVVDVSAALAGTGRETECDANVDTAVWAQNPTLPKGCALVALGLPRVIGARGPGLASPPLAAGVDLPRPAAVDVAFFAASPGVPESEVGRGLNGAFALVMLSNGDLVVVNVDSGQLVSLDPAVPPTKPPAHSIRNGLNFVTLERGGGRPRVQGQPTYGLSTNDLPFATRPQLSRTLVPRIETFPGVEDPYCSPLAALGTPVDIAACFPRPNETVGQSWAIIWEGTLPGTRRVTGRFLPPPAASPAAVGLWDDAGATFCAAGVEGDDRLQLIGCEVDTDCGSAEVYRCVPSVAGASGLCARREMAAAVEANCQSFLLSRRRYLVLEARPQQLVLGLALDELPRPSLLADPTVPGGARPGPCASDADCRPPGAPEGYVCTAATPGSGPRCLMPCSDSPCRPGFVCETVEGGARFCAEAPAFVDPICLAESSVYRVQAGQSFLVQGSFSPRIETSVETAGVCQAKLTRDSRAVNRIPFAAAACSTPPGPTWQALRQAPNAMNGWPNPCLYVGTNADAAQVGDDPAALHVKALFENADARFILTNLEQPFGDGANVAFTVRGGFSPDAVIVGSTFPEIAVPTRLLRGPGLVPAARNDTGTAVYPYVYMVDSGRVGSNQRGQILRIDTRRAGFDTARSSNSFEVQ